MVRLEVHHQGTMAGMVDVVCRWEGLGPETAAMYMGVMGLQGGVWGHVISWKLRSTRRKRTKKPTGWSILLATSKFG